MTPSDRTESKRLTALTELLRDSVKETSAAELEQGLSALRARAEPDRGARRRQWALLAAVLACVAFAVGVTGFLSQGSSPTGHPVAVDKIEGGKLLDGGYLSEVGDVGIKLFFNEGSKFELAPGARGRLRAVSAEGARLALEHGKASFQITESRDRKWSVEAGPFVVSVRGTDFAVVWDPVREELEVSLRRGRVAVSGPVVGDELVLRPGQRLSVSLPRRETVITEGGSRTPAATSSATPKRTAKNRAELRGDAARSRCRRWSAAI